MRGNKASCYFLTKVQTCIDRNLAPQIKTRLQAADVKPSWALCVCVCAHMCIRQRAFGLQLFLNNNFQLQEALTASLAQPG